MALQDLTPQLRTRLSRMERAVGWFVILATLLLVAGFGYYVYHTADRKGWFLRKLTYQTCVSSGAGLKVGDPVKLMGFDVGDITAIIPNDPHEFYNITIRFRVKVDEYNYQGYIWSDSNVKVNSGDLLGNRYLEITKGVEGVPTVLQSTNNELLGILRGHTFIKAELDKLMDKEKGKGLSRSEALAWLNEAARTNSAAYYTSRFNANVYFLDPLDSPAITERLEKVANQIETALPNILGLTNQLAAVLSNSVTLTANLNEVALAARPAVSNLALATAQLNQPGALGEWLLPTNINQKLDSVLGGLDTAVTNTSTNLTVVLQNLNSSLLSLADITSNLNQQVQANTNILSEISRAVIDTDELVQGLKRHWLLRSAFKTPRTNPPPKTANQPVRSPKDQNKN
jgi:ABC-type transporter Mla subunit MlaD